MVFDDQNGEFDTIGIAQSDRQNSLERRRHVWSSLFVGRDHDATGRRLRADEPERGRRAFLWEESLPRPQNEWMDEQDVGVDELTSMSD